MINPANVCLYVPAELKAFKLNLFNRIGKKIKLAGGQIIRGDLRRLARLRPEVIPIVGAAPYLLPLVRDWRRTGRQWIGWDRGYARRIFATWLPRGENGGYYRWHLNSYQMTAIRDVPDDRWQRLLPGNPTDPRCLEVLPWRKGGRHIVIAAPTPTYALSHDGAKDWLSSTLATLKTVTDRPIVVRDKQSTTPLLNDIRNAHCLVAHGSIAAVEAVILGCPVVVHTDSAAALVGLTDLSAIETPIYPERQPWLNSLGYSQFCEQELVNGTLWKLIE